LELDTQTQAIRQAERLALERAEAPRRIGVRALLFLVLAASAILPVAMLGLNQAKRWAASELAASDRQALAAAQAAAAQVSFAMLAYQHAAESFAAQLGGPDGLSRASLEAAMRAHVEHHPEFLGAYVANAVGLSILHLRHEGGFTFTDTPVDYSDRDYFHEILETGLPAISPVRIGRFTGVLSVQVAAPIRDTTGTLLGITCSSVDLGQVTDQAKQTVRTMAQGRVLLVDGEGHRVADSEATTRPGPQDVSPLALFAPPRSTTPELRVADDDLGRRVRGYAIGLSPPVSGWRVFALTPQSAIEAQARAVERETALLAAALAVGALVLAAAVAAWLARPVQALAANARAVSRGDFHALPEVPTNAPREMAVLTLAVRSMLERLKSHAQDLEQQVAARTAELLQANTEISAALRTIQRHERSRDEDLEQARLFQAKLLPSLPERTDLSVAAHYAPLERVGGDIYDLLELPDGTLRVFLADATGHGVQASMRTLMLKAAYDRIPAERLGPAGLLAELNRRLVQEFPDGDLHCAACCVDVTPTANGARVSIANAGSAPLYIYSPGAAAREVYAEGPLLGVVETSWPEPEPFELGPGELMVIASDGLVEQPDPQRRRFDTRLLSPELRLLGTEQSLTTSPSAAPSLAQAALGRLLSEFEAFLEGEPIRDDVTIILLSVPSRALGA
jgi:serine phosphatase RsbU (regulator of sigma subunit)